MCAGWIERVALEHETDVDVWRVDAARAPADEQLSAELSDGERARVRLLLDPRRARLYAVAHAGLRVVLGERLACAPREVALALDGDGRPRLAAVHGSAVDFNLSHTPGVSLVALSERARVGVDIESLARKREIDAVAARFFDAAERRELASAAAGEQLRVFLKLWTRREALAKLSGAGLQVALRAEGASLPSGARLSDLEVGGAHVAALALGPRG